MALGHRVDKVGLAYQHTRQSLQLKEGCAVEGCRAVIVSYRKFGFRLRFG